MAFTATKKPVTAGGCRVGLLQGAVVLPSIPFVGNTRRFFGESFPSTAPPRILVPGSCQLLTHLEQPPWRLYPSMQADAKYVCTYPPTGSRRRSRLKNGRGDKKKKSRRQSTVQDVLLPCQRTQCVDDNFCTISRVASVLSFPHRRLQHPTSFAHLSQGTNSAVVCQGSSVQRDPFWPR